MWGSDPEFPLFIELSLSDNSKLFGTSHKRDEELKNGEGIGNNQYRHFIHCRKMHGGVRDGFSASAPKQTWH